MDFRRFLVSNFNCLDLKKHLIEMSSEFFNNCDNIEILDSGSKIECTNADGFGIGIEIEPIMQDSTFESEFGTLYGTKQIKSLVTFYSILPTKIGDIIILNSKTNIQKDITFEIDEDNLSCAILEFEEKYIGQLDRKQFLNFNMQYKVTPNNYKEIESVVQNYYKMRNIILRSININNDEITTLFWPGYKCSTILDTKEREKEQYEKYPMETSITILVNNNTIEKGIKITNADEILNYWK